MPPYKSELQCSKFNPSFVTKLPLTGFSTISSNQHMCCELLITFQHHCDWPPSRWERHQLSFVHWPSYRWPRITPFWMTSTRFSECVSMCVNCHPIRLSNQRCNWPSGDSSSPTCLTGHMMMMVHSGCWWNPPHNSGRLFPRFWDLNWDKRNTEGRLLEG